MTDNPNDTAYNAQARDAIMDLAPFYDPNHKCNVVREDVFKKCLRELRHRDVADLLGHKQMSTAARYIHGPQSERHKNAARATSVMLRMAGEK